MNLNGAKALVTGGAVRIGRAVCEALAGAGCAVVIHCRESVKESEELCGLIKDKGVDCWVVRGDLSVPDECRRIMTEANDMSGGINILVNNASVFYKDSVTTLDSDRIMQGLNVNLVAPMILTESFAAQLEGACGGVINLLDRRISGLDREYVSYQLSKKMLAEFTRVAALALAPAVTVNGVAPGAILAPVGADVDLAGAVPLDHKCTVADVTDAVLYLLRADAVTGQLIFVDGGRRLND